MEENEALRIGREAVRAVTERLGDDRAAVEKELEKLALSDRRLLEALAIVGRLMLSGKQDNQH